MLEKEEFERWIEASHVMFEIFEGRYDAYPLAKKWVREWFPSKRFTIDKNDAEISDRLIQDFNYDAFRNFRDIIERDNDAWKNLVSRADQQFKRLRENNLKPRKCENVGFAVAPFLFTWNFQRFKEYFKKREDFSVEQYFKSLSEFLNGERKRFEAFADKRLVFDQIEKENVKGIFDEINTKLKEIGIKNNEPVGTIKLLHIFAPSFFPLVDNAIAKTTGLIARKWESLTCHSYVKWMNALRDWLQNYVEIIENVEKEYHSSIIKLVDEGLYMMSTVKQRARVAELGLKVN